MIDLTLSSDDSTRIVVDRSKHTYSLMSESDSEVTLIFDPIEPVEPVREENHDNG